MPTKSVKLELISADPNEYNSYIITTENLVLGSQSGNFPSNPDDASELYSYNATGGTGGYMVIGVTTHHRNHYPENLEDIEDSELRQFVEQTPNGKIVGYQLVSPGYGYTPGGIVTISEGGKSTATFSFDDIQGTAITNGTLSGPEKSFWENNHYNVKGIGNLYYRELGKNTTHKINVTGNKFERVNGWQNLFTGSHPSADLGPKGYNATGTRNFQIKTDNMISAHQAIIIGNVYGHQKNEKQRWAIPEGLMFSWTNKNSKKNSWGLRLKSIRLLWKLAGERTTTFNLLIDNGEFIDPSNSEVLGANPFVYNDGRSAWGAMKFYMPKEDYELLHKRGAACIGMFIMYENHSQGANYDNVIDFFNFRFLFNREAHPNYKMILPGSSSMVDYQTYGFRIA